MGIVVLSAVACGGGGGSSAPGNAGGGDEAAEEVGGDAQADQSQDEAAEEAEADSGGGGGSSPPGDTGGDADGDGSTPRCPAPVPAATELLANGGFEGTYTGNAPGWDTNNWGVTATYARETSGAHGGSAAQMVRVEAIPPGTGLVFKQNYTFPAGRVYQGSIWMRSPDAIDVDFVFRRAGPWYEPGAHRRVRVGPEWQQVTVRGGFREETPAFFGINFRGAGTLFIDDASLRELERTACPPEEPVPATLFGMHVNKWGTYPTWPGGTLPFGLLRLWDTGTRWVDLEPSKGTWNWERLDYYVNAAVPAQAQILLTLGMTPTWASARPAESGGGTKAEPADIADWRNYVRTVATRYRGRIQYYEIWNEANNSDTFYTGTAQSLVALTAAAREELKTVDPHNVVLSANFTTHGLAMMDDYLALGGGEHCDTFSIHDYPYRTPENTAPFFEAVRDLLEAHGVGQLPIWDTEGVPASSSGGDLEDAGVTARAYLFHWSEAIRNFGWYAWDIHDSGWIRLSQDGYIGLRPAGVAYQETMDWLVGARMVSRQVEADGTWIVELARADGSEGHVVWNILGARSFVVPTAWGVTMRRDLTGGITPARGGDSFSIGLTPVLFE